MEKYYDIENLFKEALQNHESPVNPDLWVNLSNSLSAGATTTSAAGAVVAKSSLIKSIIMGVSATAAVATSAYFIATSFAEKSANQPKEEIAQTILPEQNTPNKEENIAETEKIEENKTQKNQENNPLLTGYQPTHKSAAESFSTPKHKRDFGYTPSRLPDKKPDTAPSAKESPKQENEKPQTEAQANEKPALPKSVDIHISKNKPDAFEEVVIKSSLPQAENTWSLPDGTIKIGPELTVSFEKYGANKIQLISTLENGEELNQTRIIQVNPISSIGELPNIITPNNDGINDEYVVRIYNIQEWSLVVLNTNGAETFKSFDINDTWKGTDQAGNRLPIGSYQIIIKAIGTDGKIHKAYQIVKLTY
ncbi:MAG: gliding motility-associated C-terminal domain-containing protein [Flavobacteriales bacterium]